MKAETIPSINDIPWDGHHDIMVHRRLAQKAGRPMAALLKDLKAAGLLKETLVFMGVESGRRPWTEVAGVNRRRTPIAVHNHPSTFLLSYCNYEGATPMRISVSYSKHKTIATPA